jgi:hypothetical protein
MKFVTSGDWDEFKRIAAHISSTPFFHSALEKAMHQEALRFQSAVIRGIDSGAPGGKQFAPHSPLTIALRSSGGFGGSKVLIHTAALRNSTTVKRMGRGTFIVGVYRRAARGANIAAVHEFGASIRITPKMRRFLAAKMREAGVAPSGGPGTGYIRIPPRPFLRPVFDQEYGDRAAATQRFYENVARNIGFMLGSGGTGNTAKLAAINAEADAALADVNLDHLVGTATGIPAVVAGTYLEARDAAEMIDVDYEASGLGTFPGDAASDSASTHRRG